MRTNEHVVFGCESELWIAYYNEQLCAYSQSKIIRGILALLIEKVTQLTATLAGNGVSDQDNVDAACFDYFAYLTALNLTPFFSVGRRDGVQNSISAIKAKLVKGDN
jgi:sulfur transfer protein SufE